MENENLEYIKLFDKEDQEFIKWLIRGLEVYSDNPNCIASIKNILKGYEYPILKCINSENIQHKIKWSFKNDN